MNSEQKSLPDLLCSYKRVDRDDRDRDNRTDIDSININRDNDTHDKDDGHMESRVFQVYLLTSNHLAVLKKTNLIGICDPRRKTGMIINIGEITEINDTTVKRAEYPLWIPANHEERKNTPYDQTLCQNVYDIIEQLKQDIMVRRVTLNILTSFWSLYFILHSYMYSLVLSRLHRPACTPIVYLGGREEMKSQCELCKFCTVFHYWVTN